MDDGSMEDRVRFERTWGFEPFRLRAGRHRPLGHRSGKLNGPPPTGPRTGHRLSGTGEKKVYSAVIKAGLSGERQWLAGESNSACPVESRVN